MTRTTSSSSPDAVFTVRLQVRLPRDLVDAVDVWIAKQPQPVSRAKAMRSLLVLALKTHPEGMKQ